jgi:hypothetical protein
LHQWQSLAKSRPDNGSPGGAHLKILRNWRKICFSNQSSLRAITLCQDAEGFWVGFTEVSPEGPDLIVYLPVNHILPMADALDRVAECDDRKDLFIPCPIFGKDYWSKPARLNGAAYTLAAFRYRPVIVFNGRAGIWTAQFVSGRHARLVARLLRILHQRTVWRLCRTKGCSRPSTSVMTQRRAVSAQMQGTSGRSCKATA